MGIFARLNLLLACLTGADVPDPHPVSEPCAEMAEQGEPKVPRLWFHADFLLWWIKDSPFPPLLTTSPTTNLRPGALGFPNTTILFGGDVDNNDRCGGRFTAGYWLDDEQTLAVEGNYFFLSSRSISLIRGNLEVANPGTNLLARPYFNENSNFQDASLVTFPGVIKGRIDIRAASFLDGFEANGIVSAHRCPEFRLEGLVGFRYVNLDEDVFIRETTLVDPSSKRFPGRQIGVVDSFDCQNFFFGGQLGLRAGYRIRRLELELAGKVAFGTTHQITTIQGLTFIDTQPPTQEAAGLLALASNRGRHTRDSFAVVPEATLNLGFQLTEHLRTVLGYTFLYVSQAARPGEQIDLNVNVNQVPTSATFGAAGGPNRPAFLGRTSDFWAHGINFGVELRY